MRQRVVRGGYQGANGYRQGAYSIQEGGNTGMNGLSQNSTPQSADPSQRKQTINSISVKLSCIINNGKSHK